MTFGDLLLRARLFGHLEEQEIGQLGDVLVVGDSVVLEHVAEVPELGDDIVGDGHERVRMNGESGGLRPERIIELRENLLELAVE